ncbi:MAG: DNA repair protein RadC [Spirochaetae bacterium HGW-Spirochaetae-1]|jgi:DNA repair protein RadC|nr:MAG: DNA repair protein RadC [Spirochaetae bacterium HGW-Spirochaetae-1]
MKQFKIIREVTLKYKTGERVREYKMGSPEAVFNFLKDKIGDEAQENMVALYINNKNELQSWALVSRGTISETIVHPREVFKCALLSNASAVIMVHNHPSGHLKPSMEDINATKRINEAGMLLGIPLLDHIIISSEGFYSMRQEAFL